MGFLFDINVSAITVFVQGLLSFFTPCVLPLIPLYMGYLSGGTIKKESDGRIVYKRSKVMTNTFFFVLGVSVTFFVLGLGISTVGTAFRDFQIWITRIGGALIILLGLYQLGMFGSSRLLGNTHKLPFHLDKMVMSPVTAFIMGFTFSFAWTPCVGPTLTSVLLMTASAQKQTLGLLLIVVYTLGFVLPFLVVGLFTTTVLTFLKKHMSVIKYTVRIGGVLMILMGALMLSGKLKGTAINDSYEENKNNNRIEIEMDDIEDSQDEETKEDVVPAPDFTLIDQYGNSHTLSEYKGKVVFLNFWATWCGPCRNEMPDIQKLYEEYSAQKDTDVIILGIATPGIGGEDSVLDVTKFMEKNGYTYPVLMDTTGEVAYGIWGVSSFPTTYMIDKDGNVKGYISGQLSEDMMRSIIEQTMEGDTN